MSLLQGSWLAKGGEAGMHKMKVIGILYIILKRVFNQFCYVLLVETDSTNQHGLKTRGAYTRKPKKQGPRDHSYAPMNFTHYGS